MHKEFEMLLTSIQPKEDLIISFEKAVELVYEERKSDDALYKKNLRCEINQID